MMLVVNPQLTGYDTENGATRITNFWEEEVIVWTWEKGSWTTKKFSKITRVDELEPSAHNQNRQSQDSASTGNISDPANLTVIPENK